MAEKYKSVLEKYNESKKPRLPTAEEEAVEPVYPEEYLIGGYGKAMASGLRSSAEAAAAKVAQRQRMANVKIGSRVPDPEAVAAENAVRDKFYSTPWGKATYDDLKNRAEQAAKDKVINNIKNTAILSGNRAGNDFSGEVGNAIGNEMYRQNEAGDTYKKGGKAKTKPKTTASSRADGIAKRGKTRGRMI